MSRRRLRRRYGHTRYRKLLDPRYYEEYRVRGWNMQPTALQDMTGKVVKRAFPEMTKVDHERKAHEYARKAARISESYSRALNVAIDKYGDTHHIISAVYNEKFPEHVKNRLRSLAHGKTDLQSASQVHWKAAGKRTHWRDALGKEAGL